MVIVKKNSSKQVTIKVPIVIELLTKVRAVNVEVNAKLTNPLFI